MTLFDRLRADAAPAWDAYVRHPFVEALGDGALPAACFRRYLTQDYLFLIQFSRAYALAAYKADTLEDLRAAARTLSGLLDIEMPLHVRLCAGWGVDEAAMRAEPEALETIAYTRFVLDRGQGGDLLDLEVALAPCVLGYAEIGRRLAPKAAGGPNPYASWIETYAGTDYQSVASDAAASLERLWTRRGAEARYPALLATFRAATWLETAFWQMGLAAASDAAMVRPADVRVAQQDRAQDS